MSDSETSPKSQNDALHQQFHGQPDLPTGSTNIPVVTTSQPPELPPLTLDDMPFEFRAELALMPVDQQEIITAWFPHLFRQVSQFVNGAQLRTPAQMMKHLQGVAAQQAEAERAQEHSEVRQRRQQLIKRDAEKEARSNAYAEWIKACQDRKTIIATLKDEVDKRKAERAAFLKTVQPYIDQWDAYVNEARDEYKRIKETPSPKRP